MMRQSLLFLCCLMSVVSLAACDVNMENQEPSVSLSVSTPAGIENEKGTEENTKMKMNVQIGENTFSASLEENDAAAAFIEMIREAPVVIQMDDYSGFEKVGALGTSLPTSNQQTTAQSGDIVLYNGNQIVIFYGSNSWSYTRLGKIDNLSGWEEALGDGNVTVTFSID